MAHAICPNCGSALEIIHGFSGPSLSCPKCAWNSSAKKTTAGDVPLSLPQFLKHIPTMEEARGSFPGLLDSPIPRPLQWDWSIGVIAALIVLFAWLPIWDLVHSQYYFAATGRISGLEQGAGIAVAVYFFLLPALSRQRLLRYGGVAVGRVVHQELVQQNSSSIKSVIFYAFLDGSRILRWSAEIGMVLLELYQVRGSLAVEVMLTFHHRDVTQSKHRFQNFEREGLA